MVHQRWRFRLVLWVWVVAQLAGCSSKAFYDMNQKRNRDDCQRLPDTEREECFAQNSMSYEEYQRERKRANE